MRNVPDRREEVLFRVLRRPGPARQLLATSTRNGMKEPTTILDELPDGVELTLSELQEMATRQQQQIESQQQMLVAKEQRLKFLKQQEMQHQQVSAESERLQRLRDKMEAQETKLRKLRALWGQVDQQRMNNSNLTSELDTIRALFNEKEKELSVAVAKVDELTKQLEELRRGRANGSNMAGNRPSPAAIELEKLRRELIYHNKLNEQQNMKLTEQRDALDTKQEEMMRIDKRIAELQQRLNKKRTLNQQLANQINAVKPATTAVTTPAPTVTGPTPRPTANRLPATRVSSGPATNRPFAPNVAQVEPYQHIPKDPVVSKEPQEDPHAQEDLVGFQPGKNDPKYQTLPYNTKFSVKFGKNDCPGDDKLPDEKQVPLSGASNGPSVVAPQTVHSTPAYAPARGQATAVLQMAVATRQVTNGHRAGGQKVVHPSAVTVTSSPSSAATAAVTNVTIMAPQLTQPLSHAQTVSQPHDSSPDPKTLSSPPAANKTGILYHQTSSTRVQPLVPHTFSTTPQGLLREVEDLPAVAPDTELPSEGPVTEPVPGTVPKPALPPKPSVPSKPNPPPRQIHSAVDISPDSVDSAISILRGSGKQPASEPFPKKTSNNVLDQYLKTVGPTRDGPSTQDNAAPEDGANMQRKTHHPNDLPIKPKPLTIKKNSALEPPKLKNSASPSSGSPSSAPSTVNCTAPVKSTVTGTRLPVTGPGTGVHVSISRRIEMPPAFLFPESEAGGDDDANNNSESNSVNNKNGNNNNNNGDSEANTKNLQLTRDLTEVVSVEDISGSKQRASTKRPTVEGGPAEGTRIEGEGSSEPSSTEEVNVTEAVPVEHPVVPEDQEGPAVTDVTVSQESTENQVTNHVVRRVKKGNLKTKGSAKNPRRVSFDPLALLLDASLEGELELVKKTAKEVTNPSTANDEGITALHNAICAGHYEIVKFLVEFGCDVNAQDSDGWTPLHCAASCNNLPMVKFLVEHGACIFATTLSDQETAAEKCEEDEEGFDGCSEYLYSIQEKLGILNNGVVYALYNYEARNADELSFRDSEVMVVLRKGDDLEREWWWSKLKDREGYIPRNLLGLYPRVVPSNDP